MPGWDYSVGGYYFITVATNNHICNLGKIENDKMILSEFGKVVETQWYKSFQIRTELFLDEFIIMPNHLHAIIILDNEQFDIRDADNQRIFIRKPKSISSFIAGFKSATTIAIDNYIDDNNLALQKYDRFNKFMQANYHDHIIRNEQEYHQIKNYIINNPIQWDEDKYHKL